MLMRALVPRNLVLYLKGTVGIFPLSRRTSTPRKCRTRRNWAWTTPMRTHVTVMIVITLMNLGARRGHRGHWGLSLWAGHHFLHNFDVRKLPGFRLDLPIFVSTRHVRNGRRRGGLLVPQQSGDGKTRHFCDDHCIAHWLRVNPPKSERGLKGSSALLHPRSKMWKRNRADAKHDKNETNAHWPDTILDTTIQSFQAPMLVLAN